MSAADVPLDEQDAQVLARVRELISHVDPVPAGLAERTRFALTVHALHAEVAELTENALLPTRSADSPTRTESVTFTSGSVSLMVSSTPAPDGRTARIDGWVTRGGAEVEVVWADSSRTVVADDHGRLAVPDVPRGRIHFIVRTDPADPTERPVITPTIDL